MAFYTTNLTILSTTCGAGSSVHPDTPSQTHPSLIAWWAHQPSLEFGRSAALPLQTLLRLVEICLLLLPFVLLCGNIHRNLGYNPDLSMSSESYKVLLLSKAWAELRVHNHKQGWSGRRDRSSESWTTIPGNLSKQHVHTASNWTQTRQAALRLA